MMEKGLQAVYSGYIAGNGTTISKSKKEGIHGMQWSVNASVGAAYRFYGDWSLYFEPRFSIISTVINRLVFVRTSRWDLG